MAKHLSKHLVEGTSREFWNMIETLRGEIDNLENDIALAKESIIDTRRLIMTLCEERKEFLQAKMESESVKSSSQLN